MPLQPDLRALLDRLPPEASLEVTEMPLHKALATLRNRPDPVIEVANAPAIEEAAIDGLAGPVPIRIYRPAGRPRGTVLNFHGGGWVCGAISNDDYFCKLLARDSGCVVVSADYRLAPEHPYPAALEDAWAALEWTVAQTSRWNAPEGRIALTGCSAGGNLVAALTIKARDARGPAIAGQILLYPALDARANNPSYEENGEGYLLSASTMRWFWDLYLPLPGMRDDPLASPQVGDVTGLPPALILAASHDPLRDDAAEYAAKLTQAGVPVEHHCYDGLIHGYFRLIPDAPWVGDTIARCTALLKRAFA